MTQLASHRHRQRRQRAGVLILAVLMAVGLWPGSAAAKAQKKLAYSYEQVWSAAVRFLRVDEGFEIVEKDMDAGYVIFTVSEDGKRFQGALEIVRMGEKEEPSGLLLLVGIADRPEYMEQGILDRFGRRSPRRHRHGQRKTARRHGRDILGHRAQVLHRRNHAAAGRAWLLIQAVEPHG
jgi:hypothetical protein